LERESGAGCPIRLAPRQRNNRRIIQKSWPEKFPEKISRRIEKKSLREKIGTRIMRSTPSMAFELRSSFASLIGPG
jgi:hypothetical protein